MGYGGEPGEIYHDLPVVGGDTALEVREAADENGGAGKNLRIGECEDDLVGIGLVLVVTD